MKIEKSYIKLANIRFYAFHGVMPQEKCVGAYFLVSLRIGTQNQGAIHNDTLADTINYAEIYQTVKKEIEKPSALIEHAAGRIIDSLYTQFNAIESIDIELKKENPPMGAQCDYASVELHTTRS